MKMFIVVCGVLLGLASAWLPARSYGKTAAQEQVLDHAGPAAIPKVYVIGEVKTPGIFECLRNMRLLDALKTAGGPTPDADLSRAILLRQILYNDGTKVQGPPIAVRLDLILAGYSKYNQKLEAGDVLYVPQKQSHARPGKELSRPLRAILRPEVLDLL